jgi:hypothetical protein
VTATGNTATGSRWRITALVAATSVTPLALYFLVRPLVGSDTAALAVGAAAPAAGTLVAAAWRRQLRVLGLLTVVGLGAALVATVISGGSSLPLKLYRPLFTGAAGLAMIVSVALGRPLLVPALCALAGRMPVGSVPRRTATVVTAIVGVAFLVEAAVTVLLALSLPTGAFLIASRVVRFAIIGGALAVTGAAVRSRSTEPRGRRPWFGPRRLGIGWGAPQTWPARLVVLGVLGLLIAAHYGFHLL